MQKRFLSTVMALVLVIGLCPAAYADEHVEGLSAVSEMPADEYMHQLDETLWQHVPFEDMSFSQAVDASWAEQIEAYDNLEPLEISEAPVVDEKVEQAIDNGDIDPTTLVVFFRTDADSADVVASLAKLKYSVATKDDLAQVDQDFIMHRKTFTVRVPHRSHLQDAVDELWALKVVDLVDLNAIFHLDDDAHTAIFDEEEDSTQEATSDGYDQATSDVSKVGGTAEVLAIGSDEQGLAEERHYGASKYQLLDPAATVIDDPGDGSTGLWHLSNIDAHNAWDIKKVNGSITVAVIDTGVNVNHLDLAVNIDKARARNVVSSNNNVEDASGHGSHVAGIIAAVANNGKGCAGVSYNAKILPIKVADAKGKLSTTALCDAYDYLFEQVKTKGLSNLRVINMSLGHYETGAGNLALKERISLAKQLSILTVCAAGNKADEKEVYASSTEMMKHFPASFDDCISVAALDKANKRAAYSAYGATVDIAAPGSSIYSTVKANGYALNSGTSMASPVVSGVASLLYAYNPGYTVDQVKDLIYKSATDLSGSFKNAYGKTITYGAGKDVATGYGLVNAAAAMELAVNRKTKVSWKRYSGVSSAATARLLASRAFSKSDSAVIVRNDKYHDTIYASALAGKLNAPVLYSAATGLPADTIAAIKNLGAKKVVIIGGTGAVSVEVENTLKTLVTSVSRISGNDHMDTCLKVYQQIGSSKSNTAIVAYGSNYPDALSVASFSYASKSPVFLTKSDGTLDQSMVSAIKNGGFTVSIVRRMFWHPIKRL